MNPAEQTETCLKLSISVRRLEDERKVLSDSMRLERNKYAKTCEEISVVENQVEDLKKQKDSLLQETAILESRHKVYRLVLENISKLKEIIDVRRIVHDTTKSILKDKKILFCAAAVAIIRAISTIPQSIALFSDPARYGKTCVVLS